MEEKEFGLQTMPDDLTLTIPSGAEMAAGLPLPRLRAAHGQDMEVIGSGNPVKGSATSMNVLDLLRNKDLLLSQWIIRCQRDLNLG